MFGRYRHSPDIQQDQSPGGMATGTGWESRIPTLFLVIGFLIGVAYVFALPPMQTPDEMMHFARIYSVSKGVCLPSPDIDMPQSFEQLHETFPPWLETHRLITVGDLLKSFDVRLNESEMAGNGRERSLDGFINQNQNSCVPYLPSALAMYAGRHAGLSPLGIMYGCRIVNLMVFLAFVFFSLRMLPGFRPILFCVSLMPMTVHQAVSTSADSFTYSVSFLFISYVLRLAYDREIPTLRVHHYAVFTLLLMAVVLSKVMIFMIVLLLLIPGEKFPSRRRRWLTFASCLVIAIAVAAVWQQANTLNSQRQIEERLLRETKGLPGVDLSANIKFMYEHPVDMGIIFFNSATDLEYTYANLKDLVGTLGWLSIELPDWLIWFYVGVLLASALIQSGQIRLNLSARVIIGLFVAVGAIYLMMYGWVFETPKFVLQSLDEWKHIRVYTQGRYLIPLMFPLLLLFSNHKIRLDSRYFGAIAMGGVLVSNGIALYAIRYTYYQ
ncbi:MAG TPA: DUF2142 domain-containing protein [Geobacteraceae bacterium]|nr:DUF2142 domain-containing protein [Geobacteraceae bacterium]